MSAEQEMPIGARRARDLRLKEHREEVDGYKKRIKELEEGESVLEGIVEAYSKVADAQLKQRLEDRWLLKSEIRRNKAWMWAWLGTSTALAAIVLALILRPAFGKEQWRKSTPPTRQKLEVVTYGWHDPKRGWCSYDNGEQITVKQWKP